MGKECAQRRRDRCGDPTRLSPAASRPAAPATCPPRPGTGEGAATSTQNGGYETRAARPPHGRAASWGSDPGTAGAATHPQTGSPGWRSSGTWTAASWRPAQPRPNHINRGGGDSSGSDYRRRVRRENAAYRARRRARLPVAGSSLARSTARNRRRGPSPHNTPT